MADYSVKYDSVSAIKYGATQANIYKKIMPSTFLATKYVTDYVLKGQPLKPCRKMRTGKPLGITVHNTEDINPVIKGLSSAAEQYILATYNCNMAGSMVHYYVSYKAIWQLLDDDEQGFHSGTGSLTKIGNRGVQIGGNVDTISIECVGATAGAEETTAMLVAYLCKKYGFSPDLDIYTHKFWSGKNCPAYILPHWSDFINRVKTMMGIATTTPSPKPVNRYTSNGLTFIKAKNFKVTYYDGAKNSYGKSNYINAGFFGTYDDGITLPAANVCADINLSKLSDKAQYYLKKFVSGDKLRFNCADNFSNQFKDKNVSTLTITPPSVAMDKGVVSVGEYNKLPIGCNYAISGVPVIRNGVDVSYTNFVLKQGWDNSCMYATYRNFIGIKNNEIWIITGQTTTSNYVSTSEIYNKIKGEGFTDVICLDGGGSYVIAESGRNTISYQGNRRINTVIEF